VQIWSAPAKRSGDGALDWCLHPCRRVARILRAKFVVFNFNSQRILGVLCGSAVSLFGLLFTAETQRTQRLRRGAGKLRHTQNSPRESLTVRSC